jgi:hypothetical protein
MTNTSPEELFRQAAEVEGGMPLSAGARVVHLRSAVESGHACYIDLSGVPEEKRPAVMAEIKELVNRAKAHVPPKEIDRAPDTSTTSVRQG